MPYDAFISYSHAADGKLAPAIQAGLQRLAKPWYRLRSLNVFRDQTSLSASPSLWASIESALADSRFFLLLASPESAASPWVKKELEYWKANKPLENLLIVRTAGFIQWNAEENEFDWTDTDSLSPVLRDCFREEPHHVDLAWASNEDHVSLRNPRFQTEIARLAAPIHGRPLDQIVGEDLRQHKKTLRLARLAVGTLVVFLLMAIIGAYSAYIEKLEAEKQTRHAVARELAMRSQNISQQQPELALQLAKLAVRKTHSIDQEVVPQAEAVLYEQLSNERVLGELFPPKSVERGWEWTWDAKFNNDGSRIGIVGLAGAGIWDSQMLMRGFSQKEALSLSFSKDGQMLAVAERSGAITVFDASGKIVSSIQSHRVRASSVAFLPDGRLLVAGCDKEEKFLDCDKGNAKVWNLEGDLENTLPALSGAATAGCASPTGQHLVTVDEGGKGGIWASDGRLLKRFDGEANWLSENCFSPDGRYFVTGGCPSFQRLVPVMRSAFRSRCLPGGGVWNTNGQRVTRFNKKGASTISASYLGKSNRIAVVYNNGDTELRELKGKLIRQFEGTATVIAFSPDGSRIITLSDSGEGRTWNSKGSNVGDFFIHQAYYTAAALDPLNPRALTVSCEQVHQGHCIKGSVRLRGLHGPLLATLDGHVDGVVEIEMNPDGALIATLDGKGEVRVWNRHGSLIKLFASHHGAIRDVHFSDDNSLVMLVCKGGSRSSDCTDGLISHWTLGRDSSEKDVLHGKRIRSIESVPSSPYVLSIGCPDAKYVSNFCIQRKAFVSNTDSGETHSISSDEGSVVWTGFDTKNSRVIVVSCSKLVDYRCESSTVEEWGLNGEKLSSLTGDMIPVSTVVYDESTRRLFLGSSRLNTLWDLESGSIVKQFESDTTYQSIAAANKGKLVFSSKNGATLWQETPSLNEPLAYPHTPNATPSSSFLRFSPTGSLVAAVGCPKPGATVGRCRQEGLWLWSSDGSPIGIVNTTSKAPVVNISSFAFDQAGKRIAIGDSIGRIQVWGTRGNLLATLGKHENRVNSVGFSPDGGLLFSAGSKGPVHLWRTWGEISNMLAEASQRKTGSMSTDDCGRLLHMDSCPSLMEEAKAPPKDSPVKFVRKYFHALESKNKNAAMSMWKADKQKLLSLAQSMDNADWYRLNRLTPLYEAPSEAVVLAELASKEISQEAQSWRIKVFLTNESKKWGIVRIKSSQ